MLFSLVKTREQSALDMVATRLLHATDTLLSQQQQRISLLQQRAAALDPALILRRGYSITLHEGRAVRSPKELKKGSVVETRVEQGTFKSIVE